MKLFSDNDLITRYNRRDPDAISSIYKAYYSVIYGFVRQIIGEQSDAKDIVSETFLKLLKPNIHFENSLRLKAFLYQTAKNACLDQIKHNRLRQKVEAELVIKCLDETNNLIEAAEERAEIRDRIRMAIEELPPKCRQIFKLYFIEELKNSEIAKRLNISEKTVSNQRSLAIKLLKMTIFKMNNSTLPLFMAVSWWSGLLCHIYRLV